VAKQKPVLGYSRKGARSRYSPVIAFLALAGVALGLILGGQAELFFFYNPHATFREFLKLVFG
jgi:hypothetical protein